MGWFDEQIRERMQKDQEVFEDAFLEVAGAVLGGRGAARLMDERLAAREALDEILKYYHYKPAPEVPDSIKTAEEQIEYVLRPYGLMTRNVKLEPGWQHDAIGPMLGVLEESGAAVALLPGILRGYTFKDPETGETVPVNDRTAKRLSSEALCFYRPLPMKRLGIPDLLIYMRDCISARDLVLIFLGTLAVILAGMIEPRVYQAITGPVLASGNVSLLIGMAVFLLCAAFAGQLLGSVKNLLMKRITAKTSLAVEAAVMMRILSLPLSFFRKFSSGELSSRADSVGSLCSMLLDQILSTGLSSVLSLLYVTQIFRFTPMLVWPSIAIILVTVGLSLAVSFLQMKISAQQMQLSAEESGMSYALVSGIRKIRLAGAEKRAFARWAKHYAKGAALQYDPPALVKLNGVLMTAVSLIGTIILYDLSVRSGVTPSSYFAFSAAYGRVMGTFQSLAGIVISTASIKPVLDMAAPILETEPEMTADKEILTRVSGKMEMSHVWFRYEEDAPYILQDLSLQIKAGEYVAIVGRTGCGKSTLIRLLLGFEKPEKGAVFYDGRDLNTIDPRSLRKQMGVVTQNGDLFQGDIYSNITISAPHLTLEEAWEAAETAGIAEDIRRMPMGMHTVISEGSGGISGGQRQRLMIARAIAPKPKILIFDEATSALDNVTQKKVTEALDKLHCTRIVIAHRLSTIRSCDRILLLDKGRIAEEGTYDELIAKGGTFADLIARQRLHTETPETKDTAAAEDTAVTKDTAETEEASETKDAKEDQNND